MLAQENSRYLPLVDEESLTNGNFIEQRDLLEKLRPVLTARFSPSQCCLEGTRTEILERIRLWSADLTLTATFLWIYGLAGSGKSSIAATVCEMLAQMGTLAGSFFCKRDIPDQRDPRRILPSIAYTLARAYEPYRNCVLEVFDDEPDISSNSLTYQLNALFFKPLSNLKQQQRTPEQPLVVVIDALDECGDNKSRMEIAQSLSQIAALVPWLKFFITSRPLPALEQRFSSMDPSAIEIIDLSVINAEHDISLCTGSRLGSLVDAGQLDAKWLDGDVIEKLVKKASGLFVWTSTTMQSLESEYLGDSAIEAVLSDQPNYDDPKASLYSLYRTVLQNTRGGTSAKNLAAMKTVLGTICITSKNRPLTLNGLHEFLPRVDDHIELPLEVLKSIIKELRSVLYEDISKGNIVRVCHPTFLDFLESPERCAEYWIQPDQLNQVMMDKCFNFMQTGLVFNICGLESSYMANADIPTLEERVRSKIPENLQYSCLYWITHYTRVDQDTNDALILSLLQSLRFLYWIEVLSLIGQLRMALDSLQSASVFCKVCCLLWCLQS